jgi:hypothetical protein
MDRWADDGGAVPPVYAASDQTNDTNEGDSSLNRNGLAGKPVYRHLEQHQRAETDWAFHPFATVLGNWFDRFDAAFGLRLPKPALRLDPSLRRTCAGYFLPAHNEFGLWGEIAIAVRAAVDGTPVDVGDHLGTLLHEMLHLEQELRGKPGKHNFHNKAFRTRANAFGLIVDDKGHQTYAPDSRFLDLLRSHGVAPPRAVQVMHAVASGATPPPVPPARPGTRSRSTLKKWSCGCTNVRVGVRVFHARCTRPDCGKTYLPCGDGQ